MKTSGPNGTGSVFASEGLVTEFRNFWWKFEYGMPWHIIFKFYNILVTVWQTKLRFLTEKRLNVNSNRCRTSNCTTGPQYRWGISMFKWVWLIFMTHEKKKHNEFRFMELQKCFFLRCNDCDNGWLRKCLSYHDCWKSFHGFIRNYSYGLKFIWPLLTLDDLDTLLSHKWFRNGR